MYFQRRSVFIFLIFGFIFSKFGFYVFEIMSFLYNMAKYEEYALTKYNKITDFVNIKPKIKKIKRYDPANTLFGLEEPVGGHFTSYPMSIINPKKNIFIFQLDKYRFETYQKSFETARF